MTDKPPYSSESMMEKGSHRGFARWFWTIFFIAATVALLAGTYAYYRHETDRITQQKYEEIAAIGKLKAGQIEQWRQERITDLKRSAGGRFFGKGLQEFLRDRNNTDLQQGLQRRLAMEREVKGYADDLVLDLDGRIMLSARSQPDPVSAFERGIVEEALSKRSAALSELYRTPQGSVMLDGAVPFLDQGGQPIAVLVMRSNAESHLYPLIQSWPTPSRTAETVLVRKDGEDILFLNELRHRPDSALSLREPLIRHDVPAVQAVLGKQGMWQGRDYRGVEVLADLRPIPNSPWFMVAKVDTSEILAEAHYRGLVTALFAALVVLLAGSAIAYGYRHRQARLYQDLYRGERKQRDTEERFRIILYSIGDAVITTDSDGVVKQMNPVAEGLTGWPEAEAAGRSLEEVFHIINEKTRQRCENPVRKVLREGQVVGLANHTVLIGRNGTERVLADSGAPIRAENGDIVGVVLVFRDVTERARAAEELRNREEMLRAILAASPVGIVLTQDRKIKWVNDSWKEMFGFTNKEDWLDQPTRVMYPSQENYERIRRILYDHLEAGQVSATDASLKRKDGTLFDGHLRMKLVDNADPSKGTISAISDISERKKAEAALRDSQQRMSQLINFLPDPTLAIDREGKVIAWNRAIEEMTGVPARDMIGKGNYEYALPFFGTRRPILIDLVLAPNPEIQEAYSSFKREKGVLTAEGERGVPSNETAILWATASPLYDVNGNIVGAIESIRDVTESKRAQEEQAKSQRLLQAILDAFPAGVAMLRNRQLEWGNRAFEDILGVSPEEVRGHDVCFLYASDAEYRRVGETLYQDLAKGVFGETEVLLKHRDGSIIPCLLRLTLVDDTPGGEAAVALFMDITKRKRAADELARASERVSRILQSITDGFLTLDQEMRVTYFNKAAEELLGKKSQEVSGRGLFEAFPEARGSIFDEKYSQALREKTQMSFETYFGIEPYENWYDVRIYPLEDGISVYFQVTTERKKAEEALRESEEKYRSVVENMQDVFYRTDLEGTIIMVSPSGPEMTGYESVDEMIGLKIEDLYKNPEDRKRLLAILRERGKVRNYELELVRKDGNSITVSSNSNIYRDRSGKPSGTEGVVTDITERKRAEKALRESEEKYRVLVERANEGVLVVQDGVIRFLNPRTAEMVGYHNHELISHAFAEFIHPDDREMVLQYHFRRLRGEDFTTRYPFRILTKAGNLKWVEIAAASIQWEGRPGALVLMTDVTERKQMEEALKESEEWYRSIVEESFDGVSVHKGSKIVYANSVLHEMLGYSAGELVGMDHWLICHPDYWESVRQKAEARMRGEVFPHQYEVLLQRKDGSYFEGEINAKAVTVAGEPGVRVWVKDVSKRKRLEEVQRRLATAIEQAGEAIVMTDVHGNVEYVNPAHEQVTGYTQEEVLGSPPPFFKARELDRELRRELSDSIRKGGVWSHRIAGRRKDGTLCEIDVTIAPVRDPSGRIVSRVGVQRDVTQEVQLQQQLLQAQKMEAIGTLAGGIAHDFNNLLTVVMGFSELLLDEKDQNHPEHGDLQKIFHAAKNGAELVQRLLMFSRKSEPKPVPMNLNKQIVQVEKLLRRTIPKMIEIRLDLRSDLSDINADPSQIEQVLMNLAVNARDAMQDAGKLTVKTDIVRLDEEYCKLRVLANPGEHVLLEVSDTGHGMDKETVEHIFEPFFTTKETGRGTGLGLAMVYGIVSQHNGHIDVYSEINKGTTFRIYLPAIPAEVEPAVEDSAIMLAFGTETILLVDDEEFVRELGTRILTKQGYTVLLAKNGKEALDIFQKERSKISLVILDLIMPEMGGADCVKELLKIDPQVKILIASGFSTDASAKETIQLGAKCFVGKPFRAKDLLREVRRVLDAG